MLKYELYALKLPVKIFVRFLIPAKYYITIKSSPILAAIHVVMLRDVQVGRGGGVSQPPVNFRGDLQHPLILIFFNSSHILGTGNFY